MCQEYYLDYFYIGLESQEVPRVFLRQDAVVSIASKVTNTTFQVVLPRKQQHHNEQNAHREIGVYE